MVKVKVLVILDQEAWNGRWKDHYRVTGNKVHQSVHNTVYVPTNVANNSKKLQFYDKLQETRQCHELIAMIWSPVTAEWLQCSKWWCRKQL